MSILGSKSNKFYVTILMVVTFISVSGFARAEFQAGVASVDVTPKEQMPVSGGLGTPSPTEETKGKLQVRALVLADDDSRVAIVSVPFIGFPSTLADKVRSMVKCVTSTSTTRMTPP